MQTMIPKIPRLLTTLWLLAAAALPAAAQDWTLVWADEFDYEGAPDPGKWTYDLGGGGWGNDERQIYTADPENA